MQNLKTQILSQLDTYKDIRSLIEYEPLKFLELLKEHIRFETLIPCEFYSAYYHRFGRPPEYSLESLIKFLVLQKILGVICDSTMLLITSIGTEFREFCGFAKMPPASKITRFRQGYVEYIGMMFNRLVDITEPMMQGLCERLQKLGSAGLIDPKKAKYLIYDPTGIAAYVKENNPKFYSFKLKEAKKLAKNNPEIDPYKLVYSLFPEFAASNPFAKHQYINGCFCYAFKNGILTNGLGIIRGIFFFDERFKRLHLEIVSQKTDNPDLDKEIGDSTSFTPFCALLLNLEYNFLVKLFEAVKFNLRFVGVQFLYLII